MSRQARLPALLALFVRLGEACLHDVCKELAWEEQPASQAIHSAGTRLGYIEPTGQMAGKQRIYRLTATGRQKAAELDAGSSTERSLLDRCLEVINQAHEPMDSEQLAGLLEAEIWAVHEVLEPAVADHRVVGCVLKRDGRDLMLYRKSMGAPMPSWRVSAAPSTPRVGVDIDAAHRRPLSPAPETVREVIADQLDSVTQSSAETEVPPEDHEQFFSLYSSGELLMQRVDGSQVFFDQDETLALFQWLDRLGGTNLSRLAAPGEEIAE